MERLELVYCDPHLAVINKPGGLLSVPGRGPERQDCVVHRFRQLFPGSIAQPAVHRLDMDTSGLMVLALTAPVHRFLSTEFAQQRVEKYYVALIGGTPPGREGEIRLRFRLDPENRPHQVYDPIQGKLGVTRWRMLAQGNGWSRILFQPLTGRTHQLRLHASHPLGLGAAILGDRLYGTGREGDCLHLHATSLAFQHPLRGRVAFQVPAPF